MAKTKQVVYALTIIAIVSISFNAYQWNSNYALTSQNEDLTTKQEMTTLLTELQISVDAELAEIDSTLQLTCQQLSSLDLTSAQARVVLSELVTSNLLIVNAAIHQNDVLVIVEPTEYRNIEGIYVGDQKHNIQVRETLRPVMSEVIRLVEGWDGVVMAAPVFDAEGKHSGAVSLVLQPSMLLNVTITALSNLKDVYTFMAIQTDGRVMYDVDQSQIGAMTLTDPAFQDYPQLLAVCQRMATEKAGYDTYEFKPSLASADVVKKECFWTTIADTEWRLAIIHRLS